MVDGRAEEEAGNSGGWWTGELLYPVELRAQSLGEGRCAAAPGDYVALLEARGKQVDGIP